MKPVDALVRHDITTHVMNTTWDPNIIDRRLWWNVWHTIDIDNSIDEYARIIRLEVMKPYE